MKFMSFLVLGLCLAHSAGATTLDAANPTATLSACGGTASLEGQYVWLRDVEHCQFAFVNQIWVRDLKLGKDGKLSGRILLPQNVGSAEITASSVKSDPFSPDAYFEDLIVNN